MRHRLAGRRLGRSSSHRKALLRNLSVSLIDKERIKTTLTKAKELRRFAEKLVTLSKRETLHARRRALQRIPNRRAVAKLFDTLSARYSQRPGGYTRILKLGPRRGDNAEMALIEFVPAESAEPKTHAPSEAGDKGRAPKAAKGRRGERSKPAEETAPSKGRAKSKAKPATPRKKPAKTGDGGKAGGGGSRRKVRPKAPSGG